MESGKSTSKRWMSGTLGLLLYTKKKGEDEILHHVPPSMAWCRRQDGGPVAPSPRAAAGHLGPSRRAELPPEIGRT